MLLRILCVRAQCPPTYAAHPHIPLCLFRCNDVDDGADVECLTEVLGTALKFSLTVAPCASPEAQIKFDIEVLWSDCTCACGAIV